MDESKYQEIIAMLTVLYKKIDKLSRNGTRISSEQSYFEDLRKEAQRISHLIKG